MPDTLRTPDDLGRAIRNLREQQQLTTVELARRSAHSRDLIYRLEAGRDVSSSSLFDVLRALGSSIQITPAGMPTLEEMRERFKEPD